MSEPPKGETLLDRARELRREMTPQERKLWHLCLRTFPVKFYRQWMIQGFIVDFYCAAAKLVVEVDGSQHYEPQGREYDAQRTAILEQRGLQVLRFSNREVDQAFTAVCDAIYYAVQSRRTR